MAKRYYYTVHRDRIISYHGVMELTELLPMDDDGQQKHAAIFDKCLLLSRHGVAMEDMII